MRSERRVQRTVRRQVRRPGISLDLSADVSAHVVVNRGQDDPAAARRPDEERGPQGPDDQEEHA